MLSHSSLEDRRQRAEAIMADPHGHKVCEGCESIVLKKAVTCPSCHGYRFDENSEKVLEQAQILGSRPPRTITKQDYQ
jgi:uncharacterized paraquat-inducible protein A